jgi:hypothetical protein
MPNNEPLTQGLSVGGDKSAKVKHQTVIRLCCIDSADGMKAATAESLVPLAGIKTTVFNQPYKLLFLTGLIMAGLSFFVSNKTLDIHLHDTYYTIALNMVYGIPAGILFFYGLLYWWTGNVLFSSVLTWAHALLTALLVVLVALAPIWLNAVEP